jgi:helix-turn-helix protein
MEGKTRLIHPDKPGVIAKMRGQDIIDAHLADGWVLEEQVAPKPKAIRKPRAKKVKK